MLSPLLAILTDQISKRMATYYCSRNYQLSFWRFSTNLTSNEGLSFSYLENIKYAFILKYIIFCLILYIAYTAYQAETYVEKIGLKLIFAGGMSNLLDRFLYKGVIDFIEFNYYYGIMIFNIADVFISVGAALLIINQIKNIIKSRSPND